ncbi:MAG: hypothetical protein WDM78_10210 [Puia sp.]
MPFRKPVVGKQDGVFIKNQPDLSVILASSYLGGNNDDACFCAGIESGQ